MNPENGAGSCAGIGVQSLQDPVWGRNVGDAEHALSLAGFMNRAVAVWGYYGTATSGMRPLGPAIMSDLHQTKPVGDGGLGTPQKHI